MLKTTLIGNLGADAVVRHHNGNHAIGFSVAHNESYKDSKGTSHEKTIWVNCTYWRSKETKLIEFLTKGQMVYVEGTPSVKVYRNREGQPVAGFELRVSEIRLLGSKSDNAAQPSANGQENHQAQQRSKHKRPQPQAQHKGQAAQPAQSTPVDDLEVPEWIQ